jgi:uncharacterized protein YjbJ (UPF0337 family)
MNWGQIKTYWHTFKGKLKEKWGRLTRNKEAAIAGKREELAGKLEAKYAHDKAASEKELDDFTKSLEPKEQ